MDDTLCAGISTVRLRPADPSSTAAVRATTTAFCIWRSVRRSAFLRQEVQHARTHRWFDRFMVCEG